MTTVLELCAGLAETLCISEAHVTRHSRALGRASLLPQAAKGDAEVSLEGAVHLLLSLAADTAVEAPDVARRYAALMLKVIGDVELTAFGSEQAYFDPECSERRSLMDTLLAAVAGYSRLTEPRVPRFVCSTLHLGNRPDGAPTAALDGTAFSPDGAPTCHLEFLFAPADSADTAEPSGPPPLRRTTVIPATIFPALARLFPVADETTGAVAGGLDLLDMMGLDVEAAHSIPPVMEY